VFKIKIKHLKSLLLLVLLLMSV